MNSGLAEQALKDPEAYWKGKNWRDYYGTPAGVMGLINDRYRIVLDACAEDFNKASVSYIPRNKYPLKQDWFEWYMVGALGRTGPSVQDCRERIVWLNPPYSDIGPWLQKACETAQNGLTVLALVKHDPAVRWWNDWATKATEIWEPKHRINFDTPPGVPLNKSGNNFPSAFLLFRKHVEGIDQVQPARHRWDMRATQAWLDYKEELKKARVA